MRFLGKPIFITEFGVKGPEDYQTEWMKEAAQTLNTNKQVFAISYFNLYDNPKAWGKIQAFGLSLTKIGVVVLQNPFSTNLHLKPPVGGYRFWGSQSKIIGKKRKTQPWELDTPVKWIRPVPSPTILYYFYKHFGSELTNEYKHKYFFLQLFKGTFSGKLIAFLKFPYKLLQFNESLFYAKKLNSLGKRNR